MLNIDFSIYGFAAQESFVYVPFDIRYLLNLEIKYIGKQIYPVMYFFDTSKSLYVFDDNHLKEIRLDWIDTKYSEALYFYNYDGSEMIYSSDIESFSIKSSNFLLKWKLKYA